MSDPTNTTDSGDRAPKPKPRRHVRRFDPIFDGTTDLLFEPIFWIGKGKDRRKVSPEYIMLRRQFNDAMEGKASGMKAMIKVLRENQKAREARQEFHQTFVCRSAGEPSNADAALLILGLASVDRRDLKYVSGSGKSQRWDLVIEPDLVAAAMARASAPRLNRRQASAIEWHTRNAYSPPVTEAELEGAPLYDRGVLPRDPRETRFKPGLSGNPKGRPVKVKLDLPFEGFLNEVIVVPVEGTLREMTRLDALFWQMIKRAIGRDDRVEQLLINLLIEERSRRFKERPRRRAVTIFEVRI